VKAGLTQAATLEGLLQAERERRQHAEQVQADRFAAALERLEAAGVKKARK